MTRRRKKEEEWETSAGRKKWERRRNGRRRNKKKFGVLGCRIILWVFFFFPLSEVAACDWGAKNPPLRTDRREVIPLFSFSLFIKKKNGQTTYSHGLDEQRRVQ
jgi:hypothetical protein